MSRFNETYINDVAINSIDSIVEWIKLMFSAKDRPNVADIQVMREVTKYIITSSEQEKLMFHNAIKPVLIPETLMGFTYLKPHGYAGDHELIDRIHTNYLTQITEFRRWDLMYHELSACKALRNRKVYFNNFMDSIAVEGKKIKVLNLGSGPCRDIKEYFDDRPNSDISIDCVDMSPHAISYAKYVCVHHLDKITFFNDNVFRLNTDTKYDVIWSAGLFDYFKDNLFKKLIKKYFNLVRDGGQLVVGNINTSNVDRVTMEVLGNWYLNHRSEDHISNLVIDSNISDLDSLTINSEETTVNIFAHITK